MGDAGPRSPSLAECESSSDGARQGEVAVLVTGFGAVIPVMTREHPLGNTPQAQHPLGNTPRWLSCSGAHTNVVVAMYQYSSTSLSPTCIDIFGVGQNKSCYTRRRDITSA